MTPLLTINLLRVLFVTFTTLVGSMITVSTINSWWVGLVLGAAFGLSVVLTDRLLKGLSLRLFS
jgi:hypothetical protein